MPVKVATPTLHDLATSPRFLGLESAGKQPDGRPIFRIRYLTPGGSRTSDVGTLDYVVAIVSAKLGGGK